MFQLEDLSVRKWRISFGTQCHECAMGLSRSIMRMVDGSGRSMKMVDGVMSMGMMSVVEMVISYHSFLYVRYFFGFWLFKFL